MYGLKCVIVLFVLQLIEENRATNLGVIERSQNRFIRQVQICEIPNVPNGNVHIIRQTNSQNSPAANYLFINVTCEHNYKLYPPSNNVLLCVAGFWEKEIPTCIKCGQRLEKIYKPLIVNGSVANFGDFPWHAAIYYKEAQNQSPEYICGGSIITDKLVLTVAHCFTDDFGKRSEGTEYFIAAGKYLSNYFAIQDEFAQKRKVLRVETHPRYKGILANYAWDVALAVVNEPFEISNVIQPICIDWTSEFEREQLRENSYGHIAGWGFTEDQTETASRELRVLKVPYIEHNECTNIVPSTFIRYITPDKFCAGYTNSSSVCSGDSGGGLVFERLEDKETRFYIRGLVSVGVQNEGLCDASKYSTYTKVSDYLSFIQEVMNKKFTAQTPTTTVAPTTPPTPPALQTTTGYAESCITPNGETATCVSIYNCTIFINQALNQSKSNEASTFLRASTCENSNNDIFVCCGSVATFQKTNILSHRNINLLPTRDVCGLQNRSRRRRQAEGIPAYLDDYPWMALLEFEKNGIKNHSCLGILISKRYVLTISRCVGNSQNGEVTRVRLGEYNTETERDCLKHARIETCNPPYLDIEVENKLVHPFSIDIDSRMHQISIIRLAKEVQFTNYIRPICLPLGEETTPDGEILEFVGWGLKYRETVSPIKFALLLPVVNFQECATIYMNKTKIKLDQTQMCARGIDGKDFCQGNSGGPLMNVFAQSKNYYVEGIASFGYSICGTKDIPGVYTRVSKYLEWILDNMKP